MAIKLVYADKKSGDDKRNLYASKTGIPSDTDEKVVYAPDFSIDEKPFVYNKPTTDGKAGFAVGTSTRQIPSTEDVATVASAYGENIVNGEIIQTPKCRVTVTEIMSGAEDIKLVSGTKTKTVTATGQYFDVDKDATVTIKVITNSGVLGLNVYCTTGEQAEQEIIMLPGQNHSWEGTVTATDNLKLRIVPTM